MVDRRLGRPLGNTNVEGAVVYVTVILAPDSLCTLWPSILGQHAGEDVVPSGLKSSRPGRNAPAALVPKFQLRRGSRQRRLTPQSPENAFEYLSESLCCEEIQARRLYTGSQ